jgi:hypothetical protein
MYLYRIRYFVRRTCSSHLTLFSWSISLWSYYNRFKNIQTILNCDNSTQHANFLSILLSFNRRLFTKFFKPQVDLKQRQCLITYHLFLNKIDVFIATFASKHRSNVVRSNRFIYVFLIYVVRFPWNFPDCSSNKHRIANVEYPNSGCFWLFLGRTPFQLLTELFRYFFRQFRRKPRQLIYRIPPIILPLPTPPHVWNRDIL